MKKHIMKASFYVQMWDFYLFFLIFSQNICAIYLTLMPLYTG